MAGPIRNFLGGSAPRQLASQLGKTAAGSTPLSMSGSSSSSSSLLHTSSGRSHLVSFPPSFSTSPRSSEIFRSSSSQIGFPPSTSSTQSFSRGHHGYNPIYQPTLTETETEELRADLRNMQSNLMDEVAFQKKWKELDFPSENRTKEEVIAFNTAQLTRRIESYTTLAEREFIVANGGSTNNIVSLLKGVTDQRVSLTGEALKEFNEDFSFVLKGGEKFTLEDFQEKWLPAPEGESSIASSSTPSSSSPTGNTSILKEELKSAFDFVKEHANKKINSGFEKALEKLLIFGLGALALKIYESSGFESAEKELSKPFHIINEYLNDNNTVPSISKEIIDDTKKRFHSIQKLGNEINRLTIELKQIENVGDIKDPQLKNEQEKLALEIQNKINHCEEIIDLLAERIAENDTSLADVHGAVAKFEQLAKSTVSKDMVSESDDNFSKEDINLLIEQFQEGFSAYAEIVTSDIQTAEDFEKSKEIIAQYKDIEKLAEGITTLNSSIDEIRKSRETLQKIDSNVDQSDALSARINTFNQKVNLQTIENLSSKLDQQEQSTEEVNNQTIQNLISKIDQQESEIEKLKEEGVKKLIYVGVATVLGSLAVSFFTGRAT